MVFMESIQERTVMRKVVYIGNSVSTVSRIIELNKLTIVGIICDARRASDEMKNFAEINDIQYIICSNAKQVEEALASLQFNLVLMYSCSLILSEPTIQNYQVYNFHPGDLYSNRGSTPVSWSLVLGEEYTKIVLYRLSCAGIDLGEIVSERIVKIDDMDNVVSLREKLESFIPEMIIDLFEFIDQEKKGILVDSGIYRPRISDKDYTIDPISDSERIIKKKIKSQETYDGAILQSKNGIIRIKSWKEYLSLLEKE